MLTCDPLELTPLGASDELSVGETAASSGWYYPPPAKLLSLSRTFNLSLQPDTGSLTEYPVSGHEDSNRSTKPSFFYPSDKVLMLNVRHEALIGILSHLYLDLQPFEAPAGPGSHIQLGVSINAEAGQQVKTTFGFLEFPILISVPTTYLQECVN